MSGKHARLSPSNARWSKCPGSVREEAKYEDTPGEAAIDGTGTHALLEAVFKGVKEQGKVAEQVMASMLNTRVGVFNDDKPEGWLVTQDRLDRVKVVFDYLRARDGEVGPIAGDDGLGTGYFSESKSSPGHFFGRTDWWGTCDITLVLPKKGILEVIDYKDGRMFVAVENNSQLEGYALGKLAPFAKLDPSGAWDINSVPFHTVRMTIIQPKTEGKPVRFTEMTVGELWQKGNELAIAANATDDPAAPLVAGDHCQWCNHRDNCEERSRLAYQGVAMATSDAGPMFESIQTNQVAPSSMDSSQLAAIMDAAPMISQLLEQVKEEAQKRLKAGELVAGYKMGKGRGSNVWIDDEAMVIKKLKGVRLTDKDLYPRKLISTAQMKKHPKLQKRQINRLEKELIIYKPGKDTVVKDTREQRTPEDMFGAVVQSTPPQVEAPEQSEKDNFDDLSFM